ncbi:MAG: aldo/keto reductase [Actinobacteria bacterium]|nr:aldo/keto reductase [Actinomycetota bacterium]
MPPSAVTLNNGVQMPVIGFGTWQVPARQAREAVRWALQAGYRLIDTSLNYWNEPEVGQAIRESGLQREEIFVTTKLEGEDHGPGGALRGFRRSMHNLDIGYVDLYLVHWPGGQRIDTWKAMEEVLAGGSCRAIGASNYGVEHLEEVLEHGHVAPAVNQIEIHPSLYPRRVVEFCLNNGIAVESYSPLNQAGNLHDRVITRVAREHGRTPAQVVLRWHMQHGFIPIPRSVSPEHIKENIEVFDFALSDQDTADLDSLDRGRRFV